jgi:tryptophan synthase alpha chain
VSGSRVAAAFALAGREGRAAFIPYLTAGDPCGGGTRALARVLDRAGADLLELGVPFSDPVADGPVLQRAAERSLSAGTTLATVWQLARGIRRESEIALVLFSYLNPLLRRGLERAAREARSAGFDAVLVTDLPPEEAEDVQPVFRAAGLDTVFLVSPTSSPARMAHAARLSSGFLYVVSRTGTTGARGELARSLPATIARAKRAATGRGRGFDLPVAVGFGVASPAAALSAARLADGVVVGSALVAAAETGGPAAFERLAKGLARACRRETRRRG